MLFDISQLKKIRTQIGLTQYEFAKQANISQSMVAKIESGKLDPTYSYVKKIEQTIKQITQQQEKTAEELMHHGVFSVKSQDSLVKAIELLKKHDISQVPVIDKDRVLGLITESVLLEQTPENIKSKVVSEIMEESPPQIDHKAPISAGISLLRFYPLVLITIKGRVRGVITKADIIKTLTL
jgi:predicted transcriptional regulator